VVAAAASAGEERLWGMTKVWRREADALRLATFFNKRATEAKLLPGDIETLLQTGMIVPSRGERCENYVKIFTVVEAHKARRRLIAWPDSTNLAEKEVQRALEREHATTVFPRISNVVEGATFRFAASSDFKQFFQQYKIEEKCQKFFGFAFGGREFFLSSIATGAVSPPLFAQVLTRAVANLAIRRAAAGGVVFSHCLIDNVRFVSNDAAAIITVWSVFLEICAEVGITIGDASPPSHSHIYTFLGIDFDHAKSSIQLAEKTKRKLQEAAASINNPHLTVREVLGIFGRCVYAASVFSTNSLLHARNYFLIFKFMRRCAKRELHDLASIWNSIKASWASWLRNLAEASILITMVDNHAPAPTVYSDASMSGWGFIMFCPDGAIRSGAGRWTEDEEGDHINLLELRAVAIALDCVSSRSIPAVHLYVDNTSTLAWVQRGRGPSLEACVTCSRIADSEVRILSVSYVQSEANRADALSRMICRGAGPQSAPFGCAPCTSVLRE